ncbi:MAG: hypothetical protein IPP47_20380 [Bryobacterales bacterium]|nr:hypothetical protein [Bryobacterales bacterium]
MRHDTPMDAEPDCYKLLHVGVDHGGAGWPDIIRAAQDGRREVPRVRFIDGTGSYEAETAALVDDEGAG